MRRHGWWREAVTAVTEVTAILPCQLATHGCPSHPWDSNLTVHSSRYVSDIYHNLALTEQILSQTTRTLTKSLFQLSPVQFSSRMTRLQCKTIKERDVLQSSLHHLAAGAEVAVLRHHSCREILAAQVVLPRARGGRWAACVSKRGMLLPDMRSSVGSHTVS
jgi:hypothetical protein